ncbi:MAG: HD domain-containing protein [Candidatus Tectomicrobia bacterium]|nr:HD domain-containing protein [Candidatus Tectomicrobia bacterium]
MNVPLKEQSHALEQVPRKTDLLLYDQYCETLYSMGLTYLEKTLLSPYFREEVLIRVQHLLGRLVKEMSTRPWELLKFSLLPSGEEYFISHSLNVCLISMNIGMGLGYSESDLYKLGVASLFHDLGMFQLPRMLLESSREFTNHERKHLWRHPALGAKKAETLSSLSSDEVSQAIYQEHEREDGSGYPEREEGEAIHEFAKIIAISDTFEALCHTRPYRETLLPHDAMVSVIKMAGKTLDRKIMKVFINRMALFPVGSFVFLSTGETAQVIEAHLDSPLRPLIRVVFNKKGEPLRFRKVIDLKRRGSIKIVRPVAIRPNEFDSSHPLLR